MTKVAGGWLVLLMALSAAASVKAAEPESPVGTEGPEQVAAHVEELARMYFIKLGEFDHAGLRDMSTPEFEIMEHDGERAMRMGLDAFDERLRGAEAAGAEIRFIPHDFRTTVTSDAAWTLYVEKGALPRNANSRFYGTMIFKRVGDRWLLDKMSTVPVPAGSPNFPD
ncbi:hypothetical protein [Elongatibacter sediminis]|uniref:SnoaL-like domain-containing protein n=1 Tax=Elongatibacter sediminis TaxID=3119006 RepID=A0AAW9RDQ1_9GAMM